MTYLTIFFQSLLAGVVAYVVIRVVQEELEQHRQTQAWWAEQCERIRQSSSAWRP
jgi:hypothetical protein